MSIERYIHRETRKTWPHSQQTRKPTNRWCYQSSVGLEAVRSKLLCCSLGSAKEEVKWRPYLVSQVGINKSLSHSLGWSFLKYKVSFIWENNRNIGELLAYYSLTRGEELVIHFLSNRKPRNGVYNPHKSAQLHITRHDHVVARTPSSYKGLQQSLVLGLVDLRGPYRLTSSSLLQDGLER